MTDPHSDLPLWLRATVVSVLTLLLVCSIAAQVFVPGYAASGGQFVTLGLLGAVGAGIGLAKSIRGKDD